MFQRKHPIIISKQKIPILLRETKQCGQPGHWASGTSGFPVFSVLFDSLFD